ncbi:Os07g0246001, partial [Oryza sativa Japonica Group]
MVVCGSGGEERSEERAAKSAPLGAGRGGVCQQRGGAEHARVRSCGSREGGASRSHRAEDGAEVDSGRGGGPRRRCRRMGPRSEPAAAAPAAGKKQRLQRRGCGGSPRGEEAPAPVAGKNQRLWRRQSMRGGYPARMRRRSGRTSGEEEELARR